MHIHREWVSYKKICTVQKGRCLAGPWGGVPPLWRQKGTVLGWTAENHLWIRLLWDPLLPNRDLPTFCQQHRSFECVGPCCTPCPASLEAVRWTGLASAVIPHSLRAPECKRREPTGHPALPTSQPRLCFSSPLPSHSLRLYRLALRFGTFTCLI